MSLVFRLFESPRIPPDFLTFPSCRFVSQKYTYSSILSIYVHYIFLALKSFPLPMAKIRSLFLPNYQLFAPRRIPREIKNLDNIPDRGNYVLKDKGMRTSEQARRIASTYQGISYNVIYINQSRNRAGRSTSSKNFPNLQIKLLPITTRCYWLQGMHTCCSSFRTARSRSGGSNLTSTHNVMRL